MAVNLYKISNEISQGPTSMISQSNECSKLDVLLSNRQKEATLWHAITPSMEFLISLLQTAKAFKVELLLKIQVHQLETFEDYKINFRTNKVSGTWH